MLFLKPLSSMLVIMKKNTVLLANDSKLIIWFKLNRKKKNNIIIIKKKFVFLSSFNFLHLYFVFNFYFRHLCFRSEKLDLKQRTVNFSKDLGFAVFYFLFLFFHSFCVLFFHRIQLIAFFFYYFLGKIFEEW